VRIDGTTLYSGESFMTQAARNRTDMRGGFLLTKRTLIYDRDDSFTESLKKAIRDSGVELVATVDQASNCSAHAERNHQGIGSERIDGGELSVVVSIGCRERLGGLLKDYPRAA